MKTSYSLRGILLLSALFASALRAQTTNPSQPTDTVRVMTYNLLNYGNSANRPFYKNARLSTVIQHAQPDVLGVNEVLSQPALLDSILAALGTGWAHSTYTNLGGQTQTNALFYKSSLFELRSQRVISHALRDIVAYRLRFRDGLTIPHDTAFFTVVVCHLKAAQGSAEEAERAAEAATIATYLDSLGAGSYLVMGDMNVYSSNEAAYQTFLADPNPTVRLYDPIARPGAWSGNATFADIHTQSPRTTNTLGDGGANGGLDDRFDQILFSGPVMQSGSAVQYLAGSYKTVGQDGLHYNGSLLDAPVDASAPAPVIQALYEMSDHLPVYADLVIRPTGASAGIAQSSANKWMEMRVVNPVRDGWLDVRLNADFGAVQMMLVGMDGRTVWRWLGDARNGAVREWIGGDVVPGVYALVVESAGGRTVQRVVVR